jgi:hypothetical protein
MADVGHVHALRSTRSFDDSPYTVLSCVLVLSPLLYAIDNDPYRAWEVAFVGIVILWIANAIPFHGRWTGEMMTLVAYSAILVFQQLFVPNGSLWFGAKYAVSMTTVFIPIWVISSLQWKLSDFSGTWDRAIRIVAAIAVINFGASYALGIGEIRPGGRAFGYLGDSFTPILIFLILYFLFQRNYGWSLAVFSALVVTQGKAAAITLLFALGLHAFLASRYAFLASRGITRVLLILATVLSILVVGLFAIRTALSIEVIDMSLTTRLMSYERGLMLSERYPAFGVGINQSMKGALESGQALARLANIRSFDAGNSQIDNAFLRTMAETGVFGLAVLIALCGILLRRALFSIRVVWHAPSSRVRALVLASGIWVISFITTYQFVGWFEAGHPQMTWLLLISAAGYAASQTYEKVAVASAHHVAAGGQP